MLLNIHKLYIFQMIEFFAFREKKLNSNIISFAKFRPLNVAVKKGKHRYAK